MVRRFFKNFNKYFLKKTEVVFGILNFYCKFE